MTWQELYEDAVNQLSSRGIESPEILAKHWLLDCFRARPNQLNNQPSKKTLEKAFLQLEQLCNHVPLEHISGVSFFYGHRLKVSKDVLIPRAETEELVRWILENHGQNKFKFADICTGSGCIALVLAHERSLWEGSAIDLSESALHVAKDNIIHSDLEKRVHVLKKDILLEDDYPFNKLDLIVSNPPYISSSEWERMDKSVRMYEPKMALFVENENPLLFYERITDLAIKHLELEGWLYFECNDLYTKEVSQLLNQRGFKSIEILTDMQGKQRHVRGQWM